jgi:hypothetical protein
MVSSAARKMSFTYLSPAEIIPLNCMWTTFGGTDLAQPNS